MRLKQQFNVNGGWLYVFHDSPFIIGGGEETVLIVPPGLVDEYQKFYGPSVKVLANERLPE